MLEKPFILAVVKSTRIAVLGALLGILSNSTRADLIAFTSFEEPDLFAAPYTDTGDAGTDHALVNNPGEPIVNFSPDPSDMELGFTSFYTNTRNGVGLTDGDEVGVTDDKANHGTQAFQISDPDGLMTITLETVSLTGYLTASVSIDILVADTSWEPAQGDRIRVWITVDGGTEIDLLNTSGQDIDDLGIEGAWNTYTANLTGYTFATLAFELDSNAATETVYFDNIQFVPLPGSMILAGLGLSCAALLTRARKFSSTKN